MDYSNSIYEALRAQTKLEPVSQLEERLNYQFRNRSLLYQALTHSSAAQDYNILSQKQFRGEPLNFNERLEFLGDAVLGLVITTDLWNRGQKFREGDLSKIRAALVSEDSLYDIAEEIALGGYLLFGRSESLSGGGRKKSILADAVEALFAAIYCDGGFDAAQTVITRLFNERLTQDLENFLQVDFKSLLQEYAQDKFKVAPVYHLVNEDGPSHQRQFTVAVKLRQKILATGQGLTKKKASQEAARIAMEKIVLDEEEMRHG